VLSTLRAVAAPRLEYAGVPQHQPSRQFDSRFVDSNNRFGPLEASMAKLNINGKAHDVSGWRDPLPGVIRKQWD
jgi:hypothetical protein